MSLPVHGKISCHKCYQTCVDDLHQPHNLWNMRNDPAAWGGSEPEVLVLGFSKGSTQANIYQNGKFEDIAFGGVARNRLDEALKRIGVFPLEEHITKHIEDRDSRFAFGSLVRCSLTREGKDGKHASSGPLVVKSFKEIPDILNNCAQKFLAGLPEKTKTILMLGVSDAYIDGCYKLISNIYPAMKKINDVAYCDGNKLFVHITHPSPSNGNFSNWTVGNTKFELAVEALKHHISGSYLYSTQQVEISPQSSKAINDVEEPSKKIKMFCDAEPVVLEDNIYLTRKGRVPVSTIRTYCVPFNIRQKNQYGYAVGEAPIKGNNDYTRSYDEALDKLRKAPCAGWRAYGSGVGSAKGSVRQAIAWITQEDANILLSEPNDERRVQLFHSLTDVIK